MTAPRWLSEEPWLQKLLGWFLDRLETPRDRDITRRVTPKNIPALFKFDGDSDYRWKLIEDLGNEYQIFTITPDRKLSRSHVHYDNAQLRLNLDCENILREWLQRPRISPEQKEWQNAIAATGHNFQDQGQSLLHTLPKVTGRNPAEIAKAFVEISDCLNRNLTLREISAKCFWGDSKYLDSRKELLYKLLGNIDSLICPRPLLLTAWAPSNFLSLLIVENQDTFLRLVDAPPKDYALIYSGGFRAGA